LALAETALEGDVAAERPARVVWALAWPVVLMNSLQVINTLLDRGFTGRLSAAALTGYGASNNVSFLMFSLGVVRRGGASKFARCT
jgi:Na+-driven multidrug efflux pump